MAAKALGSLSSGELGFQKLAEKLQWGPLPSGVLEPLGEIYEGLSGPDMPDRRDLAFIQAGGVVPLSRLLMGTTPTHSAPDPNISPSVISEAAAAALSALLRRQKVVMPELRVAKGILLPLIDAIRDAPHMTGRCAAQLALGLLAQAQPKKCKAMVKAGVFEHVFALCKDMGHEVWGTNLGCQASVLACELLCSKHVSARQLESVIRSPNTVQTLTVLVNLQDCFMGREGNVVGTAIDAGVVDAMIDTLKHHDSPFCITVAAACLGFVARASGNRGQALIEASGAVPELIRILERAPKAGDPKDYPNAFFRAAISPRSEPLHLNDPIPVALASLLAAPLSNPLLDSFVKAGGVPALVKLLRESTSPLMVEQTLELMTALMSSIGRPRTAHRCKELADLFHHAGLPRASLRALRRADEGLRGRLLQVLFTFFTSLSNKHDAAAMKVLVEGGVVELMANYMADASLAMLSNGLGMLLVLSEDMEGRKRMGSQKLVEPFTKGVSKWLREAQGGLLHFISKLTAIIFNASPGFLPAALEANLIPDLVRLLREIVPRGLPPGQDPSLEVSVSLDATLSCLERLLTSEGAGIRASNRKSAIDAGVVAVLLDLLRLDHDEAIFVRILGVITSMALPAPCDEIRKWAGGLPRALAEIVKSKPPREATLAMDALFQIGLMHREMMLAYDAWGIDDAVKQLRDHPDPPIACAARRVLVLASEEWDVGDQVLLDELMRQGLLPTEFIDKMRGVIPFAHPIASSPNPNQRCQTGSPASQTVAKPAPARVVDECNRAAVNHHQKTTASGTKPDGIRLSAAQDAKVPPRVGRNPRVSPPKSESVQDAPSQAVQNGQGAGQEKRTGSPAKREKTRPSGAAEPPVSGGGGTGVPASPGRRGPRKVRACVVCGITEQKLETGKLKECCGCRSVRYCGTLCQKAHWLTHKEACKRLQAARQGDGVASSAGFARSSKVEARSSKADAV